MNVSSILTKDYENIPLRRRGENKPNQTQFLESPNDGLSFLRKQESSLFDGPGFRIKCGMTGRTKHNYLPMPLFPLTSSTARDYNGIFSRLSISRERQLKGFGNEYE